MFNNETTYRRVHFDFWLLITTILLLAMGVTMVYSSSAMLASERFNDSYHFLKKEIIFVVIGLVFLGVVLRIPYSFYRKLVYPILGLAFVGLILTFIPSLRSEVGGAARWIRVGSIAFQPSEFVKLALVIFLAYSLAKKQKKIMIM